MHQGTDRNGGTVSRRRVERCECAQPDGCGNVANKIATSQIALPKSSCDLVYATSGYSQSITNLSQVSLATDNVFSDGSSLELATVTGSVADGLVASLTIAV